MKGRGWEASASVLKSFVQFSDTGAALCDSEVPITLLEEGKWRQGPAHQTREGRPERDPAT